MKGIARRMQFALVFARLAAIAETREAAKDLTIR
jgi:hypothetical protein